MSRPPRRNLPPDSEQWGRWVEENISGLGQSSTASDQGTANGLGAINGALQQLSQQISAVASAQANAAAAVEKLSSLQTYASAPSGTLTLATPNSTAFTVGASGPSVTFNAPNNTYALVTLTASSIGHTTPGGAAGGSQATTSLTFEVVGNPSYPFGLNTTTSEFAQQVSVTSASAPIYNPAVLTVPVSRTFLVTGLAGAPQTINMRLRGRSVSTTANHQATDPILTVQIIPGPGF